MDKKLNDLIRDIRGLYRDARIYLFGSRARGKAHADSDYDLIIVSKDFGRTKFVNRAGTIRRHSNSGIAADLICYTPKEFAAFSKKSFMLKEALGYAIPL